MVATADDNSYKEFDDVISRIADYVYEFDIKSEKAWSNGKAALLDALGCAFECLIVSNDCRKMIGPVFPGTATVPNGFKLPGTCYQLDMLKGAFDMGVLIRYLDHNDAFFGAEWGHPSGNIGIEHQPVHVLTQKRQLRRNPGGFGYTQSDRRKKNHYGYHP